MPAKWVVSYCSLYSPLKVGMLRLSPRKINITIHYHFRFLDFTAYTTDSPLVNWGPFTGKSRGSQSWAALLASPLTDFFTFFPLCVWFFLCPTLHYLVWCHIYLQWKKLWFIIYRMFILWSLIYYFLMALIYNSWDQIVPFICHMNTEDWRSWST